MERLCVLEGFCVDEAVPPFRRPCRRSARSAPVPERMRMEKEIEELRKKVRRLEELSAAGQNDSVISSLTASFMHEVNNLTGIGVTAASVLETRVAETAERLKNGTLKRSDLERFFDEAAETSKILSVNFKQTATLFRRSKRSPSIVPAATSAVSC